MEKTREACLLGDKRLWLCRIASNNSSGASEDLAELTTCITLLVPAPRPAPPCLGRGEAHQCRPISSIPLFCQNVPCPYESRSVRFLVLGSATSVPSMAIGGERFEARNNSVISGGSSDIEAMTEELPLADGLSNQTIEKALGRFAEAAASSPTVSRRVGAGGTVQLGVTKVRWPLRGRTTAEDAAYFSKCPREFASPRKTQRDTDGTGRRFFLKKLVVVGIWRRVPIPAATISGFVL